MNDFNKYKTTTTADYYIKQQTHRCRLNQNIAYKLRLET